MRIPYKTFGALALSSALAAPAMATDITQMSDVETEAFGAQVRSYLLENPEVLMEAIAVLEQRQAQQAASSDIDMIEQNRAALFEDESAYVGGNPEGDVTMVEFLDYRCGYCRKAHPEVAELVESDGNIRIIVKEFPILGEESLRGSQFALAVLRMAGGDAYKSVMDKLMTQREAITEDSLRSLAKEEGLDADALIEEMSSPQIAQIIEENRALATRMQINGTPSFIFGDQMVRGYIPLDTMQQIVEEERES
ncbi:DsbA family protein [Profundibacterium mesophilum]|uniref:DSBA oxidoreductase n=1 Tax=Profundibacterium mesophilum KAUST100406-0324 TaxID=1037889 RepID=A0A921P1S2_9RHOB|nr:DsbA family protein [Profundibacterium mesophilum]KAF0677633.1 DSBA oxidoreductase [Profundibacterium mesophilum KAUST100406-0324]